MPKFKTRKAAAKRFKINKAGKIFRYKANKKHLLEHDTRSKLRQKSGKIQVSGSDENKIRKMLGA